MPHKIGAGVLQMLDSPDCQIVEVQRELELQRRRCEEQQAQIGSLCKELNQVKAGLLGVYQHFPFLQPRSSPARQLPSRDLHKVRAFAIARLNARPDPTTGPGE